jgi:hypothetical protein
MMSEKIRLTVLGLWLGAMALFSFIVAPAAFAVLPTRHLAGQVVSRVLSGVEALGIILGLTLIAILFLSRKVRGHAFGIELIALATMTGAMIASKLIVSARLSEWRLRLGEGLSQLPATDPSKASFDLLHQVSVWLMGLTMLLAIGLSVWLIRRTR